MNTDKRGLENAELTEKIIRVFFDVLEFGYFGSAETTTRIEIPPVVKSRP